MNNTCTYSLGSSRQQEGIWAQCSRVPFSMAAPKFVMCCKCQSDFSSVLLHMPLTRHWPKKRNVFFEFWDININICSLVELFFTGFTEWLIYTHLQGNLPVIFIIVIWYMKTCKNQSNTISEIFFSLFFIFSLLSYWSGSVWTLHTRVLLSLVRSENGILLFADKCFVTTQFLARKGGLSSQLLTAIGFAPT